jgi:hypothetical protein
MAEDSQEEGVVPACALDFASEGCAIGVGSDDVECEPAQDGEVLGRMVLSGTIAILGEVDIEHPMKTVFDAPVAAGDVQQPLGGHILGQKIVAYDRRVGLAGLAGVCAR